MLAVGVQGSFAVDVPAMKEDLCVPALFLSAIDARWCWQTDGAMRAVAMVVESEKPSVMPTADALLHRQVQHSKSDQSAGAFT